MLFIGVMSGTSCDGVDVVLMDLGNRHKTLASCYQAYPDELKAKLHQLIEQQHTSLQELSQLDVRLARFCANVINQLLHRQQLLPDEITAIGLHGQTVFHDPSSNHPNTLQWGSAAVVAAQTRINVVSGFRQLDMALGGQGAPLAPAYHQHLLSGRSTPAAIINLGGIANLTVLQEGTSLGFDTGPANCLLDGWCARHTGEPFDKAGQWANQGEVIPDLLASMMADAYFRLEYPKSTGREHFNQHWVDAQLQGVNASAVDIQRTLLQLTAQSVALGLKQTGVAVDEVFVCGGGVHNQVLLRALAKELGVPVHSSEVLGVDPDLMEACLMAWLAWQKVTGTALDLTAVTGASAPHVYGNLIEI